MVESMGESRIGSMSESLDASRIGSMGESRRSDPCQAPSTYRL